MEMVDDIKKQCVQIFQYLSMTEDYNLDELNRDVRNVIDTTRLIDSEPADKIHNRWETELKDYEEAHLKHKAGVELSDYDIIQITHVNKRFEAKVLYRLHQRICSYISQVFNEFNIST